MTRSRREASPTASGGEPRCNETTTPLSVLEFRIVQRVLTGRLQPGPSTDRVMLPSSVRTTPTAVGRLSHGIPVFTNEPLQFEATTMTRAHHPRVLHDDQDQRAARISRDLETDRRAPDDRVRGDPVVNGREPVPHSGAVNRSTHHPLGTGCRPVPLPRPGRPALRVSTNRCVCWAVRTRSCVKEKCSFKSKGMVSPVVFRRCVARSSRNCCEEVTGGTSLCIMKPSKWHERWPCRRPLSATERRRWDSRATASWLR